MAHSSPTEQSTRDVAERWFTALTGRELTIEAAHQFQLDADGRIRRWRAFFDPNPEVDVLRDAQDGAGARHSSAA